MMPRFHRAAALLACAIVSFVMPARVVRAQASCVTTQMLADSARDEVESVLTSGSQLVSEMRQEQHLPATGGIGPVSVVRDRAVCTRLATAFDRKLAPGVSMVVLRVGPLYYARDPDQRKSTGIVTDSAFTVLLRLGASISTPQPAAERR